MKTREQEEFIQQQISPSPRLSQKNDESKDFSFRIST